MPPCLLETMRVLAELFEVEKMFYSTFNHIKLVKFVAPVFLLIFFVLDAHAAPKAELIKFWNDNEPLSTMQVDHNPWQEILTAYVDDQHASGINRFDYSAVTASDARKLKEYLAAIQKIEPRQLNPNEAKAYWINMFNAVLVDKVVDTYQSGSRRAIRRILNGGIRSSGWGKEVAEVVMQSISLNDIEHGILRPIWNDHRIHFALSANTVSGANIQKTAFSGNNIEELLEKARVEFFQHPRSVRVNGNRMILNSIFEWYASDFASNKRALLAYISENVSEDKRQAIRGLTKIRYDYSWNLNAPDAEVEDFEFISE